MNATKIFARPQENGRQVLVYSMSINARDELAMILPLPSRLPAGENDVEFIDLKDYPQFFADLDSGFPKRQSLSISTLEHSRGPARAAAALAVVAVGEFEASFVPSLQDFSRLDKRFRLADEVWKTLPGYESYSFAVFKLKKGAMKVHPMAFSFPRRDPRTVFFPTVHIHDGKVHKEAEFDHSLYAQPSPGQILSVREWQETSTNAVAFMKMNRTKGVLLPDQHCYKLELAGMLPNRDTFLALAT